MYLFVGIFAGNGVKTNYFYLNRFHLNKLASLYKKRFEVQILFSTWWKYSDIPKSSHVIYSFSANQNFRRMQRRSDVSLKWLGYMSDHKIKHFACEIFFRKSRNQTFKILSSLWFLKIKRLEIFKGMISKLFKLTIHWKYFWYLFPKICASKMQW